MSERDREIRRAAPDASGEDPLEARLRALCATAALPLTPSEKLQRRVAELTALNDARPTRHNFRWAPWPILPRLAAAMAAALLLAAFALAALRWEHGRGITGRPTPIAHQPEPNPAAPPPRLSPQRKLAPRTRIADRFTHPSSPGLGVRRTTSVPLEGHGGSGQAATSALHVPRRLTSPGVRQRIAAQPERPAALPDSAYLDGRDPRLQAQWVARDARAEAEMRQLEKRLPRLRDDFVHVPLPQIAIAGESESSVLAGAIHAYKKEAKVVDARLYRKVTLQLKATSLEDLCAALETQTGVHLRAARSVGDEKATLFVKELPARDVMRAVARLFGYYWLRAGAEGAYHYELTQDLKSQLEEEALRNADAQAALLAIDAEMNKFLPYLGASFEQLETRAEQNRDDRHLLFDVMHNAGWAGMQLYHHLAASDRAALMAGQELVFRPDAASPDRRLPAEWQRPMLQSWGPYSVKFNGQPTRIAELPEIQVTQVRLKLNRTELGEVSLAVRITAAWQRGNTRAGVSQLVKLAIGRSPSAAKPDNAAANAALREQAPFDQIVSLHPEPSCLRLKRLKPGEQEPRFYSASIVDRSQPHVFSGDVWEAVHRKTGLPIVADSYTRIYRLDQVTVTKEPLFEALCTVGDAMGTRWTKDGDFLLCRSTSYLWDKLKEVPNRYLQRWARDREANGGLPLADLLEMASLPDTQLASAFVAEGIEHCLDLPEWGIAAGAPAGDTRLRQMARFLAMLTPDQQHQAFLPAGVPFKELPAEQQQAAMQLQYALNAASESEGGQSLGIKPDEWGRAEIYAEYAPAGWYRWTPPMWRPVPMAPTTGRTAAEALAAARGMWTDAGAEAVTKVEYAHFSAGVRFVGSGPLKPNLSAGAP